MRLFYYIIIGLNKKFMINSYRDLLFYLKSDKLALKKKYKLPKYKIDEIWKFQILLRLCEYLNNCHRHFLGRLFRKILLIKFYNKSYKLGFSIGLNVFGPGLAIVHHGTIVVHSAARIGKNCRIHEGVTIGSNASAPTAPQIGDNVYIASGAKIIGNIRIASGVVIGANAVVVKDICEPNITVAGVPAKKISDNDSSKYLVSATALLEKDVII